MNKSEDNLLLFARLDDLCNYADGGELKSSCFLSPRELHFSGIYLEKKGMRARALTWGGYADAERKKIFVLPEYMDGVTEYRQIFDFGYEDAVLAVSIKGSGYKRLSHRDFLGSVLGLGLRRDVIGDIIVTGESHADALVICDAAVADFICDTLTKVGSDTVRTSKVSLSADFAPKRQLLHISDTVASARLDAVVGALCSLSRGNAREAVEAGLVELEYECEERADRTVEAPAIISVRGYGKFKVNSVSETTRKGRIRLDADKYL